MLAVKSMDVRDNFKSFCDKVFDGETLIISRPKNENIVMISETEYNDMMKAKRNAEYRIPFEISGEKPNAETLEAMEEVEKMKADESIGKAYSDVDQMMEDLFSK